MSQAESSEVTPCLEDSARWFCLKTRPKQEQAAARHLTRLDTVETFCPMIRYEVARRNAASGKMQVTEAMFPGYLFAYFEWESHFRVIRSSPCVSTILHFGAEPATLDAGIIAELKILQKQTKDAPEGLFRVGEKVQVVTGPLRDFEAVVTRVLPASERIRILVDFLGRSLEMEVPRPALLSVTKRTTMNRHAE